LLLQSSFVGGQVAHHKQDTVVEMIYATHSGGLGEPSRSPYKHRQN